MTMTELNGRIKELVKSIPEDDRVAAALRSELLAHLNTPEGREELMASAQRSAKPAEAVEMLMQGCYSRIRRERTALLGGK